MVTQLFFVRNQSIFLICIANKLIIIPIRYEYWVCLFVKMSQNSFSNKSFQRESQPTTERFSNMDNLLVLEKALEQSGQDWIENMNILEQLLVRVTDRLSQQNPGLRSKFIIRRLPTYLVSIFFRYLSLPK